METFHSSIMPAEMSVVDVMIASNSASEPEAISASLRLFTASITMATLLARMPIIALNDANNTLEAMPIQLVRMICALRFVCSLVFSFSSLL